MIAKAEAYLAAGQLEAAWAQLDYIDACWAKADENEHEYRYVPAWLLDDLKDDRP